MLKKIGLGVLVVIAVLVVVIATRPAAFSIERNATIAASPEVVFSFLDDFHQWSKWSPWDKRDPNMRRTYEGAPSGVGAMYSWEGNSQVGEGRMTLTESQPNERVRIKLDFIKPFTATNEVDLTIKPAAGAVVVAWVMRGNNNFMAKAFSMVMDMDKMVGKDFEAGLGQLKQASEEEARRRADEAKKKTAAPPVAAVPPKP